MKLTIEIDVDKNSKEFSLYIEGKNDERSTITASVDGSTYSNYQDIEKQVSISLKRHSTFFSAMVDDVLP